MRNAQGGTGKWCPQCKTTQKCAAVNPSQLGERSGQRWYQLDNEDLQYFRKGLICTVCKHKWLSAEVEEVFLNELVELRAALREIKTNAEAYVTESGRASQSLKKLAESLRVLRALQIYEHQS